jgi:hypothetical protein
MKKTGFVFLLAAVAAVGAVALPGVASAQVQVDIGISVPLPPLPRFVFPAPPEVVVIPETYMYVVPEVEVDIVFYQGYWYRPHSDRWYRASSYNGPWNLLTVEHVPNAFKTLPPGFRKVKPEHARIPYHNVEQNWKKWEPERHWDSSPKQSGGGGQHEEPGDKGQGHGKGKGHDK